MSSLSTIARPGLAGLPKYEPGRPLEEVARELGIDSIDGIVKLASNENALGPSSKAIEAMKTAASEMHIYPDGGAYYLRQALARKLELSADNLVLTNGSNEAIELLGHCFLTKGSNIVTSQHAFLIYRLMANLFEADTRVSPETELTHDLAGMLSMIDSQTRLVFIANPNNPTGTMVDEAALDLFVSKVPDHVLVVIDEAYIELLPPERRPDVLKYVREGNQVVILRTFSKAYGLAGLRVGYAIAPSDGIDLLNTVRQPFNLNAMAQAAALAALADDEHVAKTRKMSREGLDYLYDALDERKIAYVPSVANFLLVKTGDSRDFFEQLQRESVIVRPNGGLWLSRLHKSHCRDSRSE